MTISKLGKYDDGTLDNLYAYAKVFTPDGKRIDRHHEALTFPEYLSWKIHYERLGLKVQFHECVFGDGTYE